MQKGLSLLLVLFMVGLCRGEEPKLDVPVIDPEQLTIEDSDEPVWIVERKLWTGQVEFGINGATGNTERFDSRMGFAGKREGPRADLTLDLVYSKASADGEETQNQLISNVRHEWRLKESPWKVYAYGNATYDEFQNWNVRLLGGGGLGYEFIKTDTTSLQARAGAGASREIGGFDNRVVPEANLGAEFSYKISDRQSLTADVEYFPSFLEFSDFRVNSRLAWELVIDPVHHLNLKIGLNDRYQSVPDGAKKNDLNYFAQLVLKF